MNCGTSVGGIRPTTELQDPETRGSKAIKLGSWDKHPAYCWDLNVELVVYEINVMVYFQPGE